MTVGEVVVYVAPCEWTLCKGLVKFMSHGADHLWEIQSYCRMHKYVLMMVYSRWRQFVLQLVFPREFMDHAMQCVETRTRNVPNPLSSVQDSLRSRQGLSVHKAYILIVHTLMQQSLFPGLHTIQFLIACSMQEWSEMPGSIYRCI